MIKSNHKEILKTSAIVNTGATDPGFKPNNNRFDILQEHVNFVLLRLILFEL